MEINRVGQSFNQITGKAKAQTTNASPFGNDEVSIGDKGPEKVISPSKFKELFDTSGAVRVMWKHSWGSDSSYFTKGAMVSRDGPAYVASGGNIKKLNGLTGKVEWEHNFGKQAKSLDSSPGTEGKDGSILVTTNDKRLRALDKNTGAERWHFDMQTTGYETPVAPDGTVFTRYKGELVALTPQGQEKFRFPMNDYRHQVRYIEKSGIAYVESDRGIFAINPDGSEKWHVPGNHVERFTTDPNRMYTVQDKWIPDPERRGTSVLHNQLVMRDPKTGEKKWERMFKAIRVPGAVGGRVFVREPRKIHGLSADSGRILWTRESEAMPDVKMVGKDGTLYVGEGDQIVAVDPGSGKTKWSIDSGPTNNSPAYMTRDGMLLINDDKTLYGIDPENGQIHYKYRTNNGIEQFTPGPDERKVYLEESETGDVLAVDLRTANAMARDMIEKSGEDAEKREINVGEKYVDVGGVRLPRRKRD